MSDQNLIISLYPKGKRGELSFNFQALRVRDFLPGLMHSLSAHINEARDQVELEKAIDEYLNFITKTLDSIQQSLERSKVRELVNQRRIYVLSLGPNLLIAEGGEPVYLAHPIGRRSGNLSILTFNEDDIGEELDQIMLEPSIHGSEVYITTVKDQVLLNDNPIDDAIDLTRAIFHFQKSYQFYSSLDNLATQVDSALEASYSIFRTFLDLFKPYPSSLEQHLINLKLKDHFDFFGLQKLGTEPEIVGLSINNNRTALIYRELTDELKILMMGDYNIFELKHAIESVENNPEFDFQLDRVKSGLEINQRSYREFYDILGISAIDRIIEEYPKSKKVAIPVYFFRVATEGNIRRVTTNMNLRLLPNSLVVAIDYIVNPLNLVATGPFETFQKKVKDIGIVLKIGDHYAQISFEPTGDTELFIEVSYIVEDIDELHKIFKTRGEKLPDYLNNPHLDLLRFQMAKLIRDTSKNWREITVDLSEQDQFFGSILVPFVKEVLDGKVVPILIRRVIQEIESLEDDEEMNEILSTLLDDESPEEENASFTSMFSKQRKEEKNLEALRKKLITLEGEIKAFNSTIFEHLMDSYTRNYSNEIDDLYENELEQRLDFLQQKFISIKINLISAGLTPQNWKFLSYENIEGIHKNRYEEVHSKLIQTIGKHSEKNTEEIETMIAEALNHEKFKRFVIEDFKGTQILKSNRIWDPYIYESAILEKLTDPPLLNSVEDIIATTFPKRKMYTIDLPDTKNKQGR